MRGLLRVAGAATLLGVGWSGAAAGARRAIVVLGCPTAPDGRPTAALERRLRTALELAEADPTALVVVSGGGVASPPEGPAMGRWLIDHGVAPERLLVEDQARSTAENADRVAPMLARAGVDRVTVVTERFHLRRGLFHVAAALSARGMAAVRVDGAAAPDELVGLERPVRATAEALALCRDALARMGLPWPGRLLFPSSPPSPPPPRR